MILNLILVVLIIGLHAFWIYKLVTYDWTKFEEDSEGDDFLKPLNDTI
jgi:Ni,Fe-hydrogenase I large subunit